MRVLFLMAPFVFTLSVQAEYRLYLLRITDHKTQKTRTLYSTLDPLQYKMISILSPDESIDYVDTWKCKGNTGGYKIHCAKPLEKIAENQPQN
jgi:hypothetical protein